MPKKIENIQSKILSKGKEILDNGGFDAFNIRALSKECDIAIGTIYNYYPSKENLIANIMLLDWQKEIEKSKNKIKPSFDGYHTIKIIFETVLSFQQSCRETWGLSANSDKVQSELSSLLFKELSDLIHSTLLYFCVNMSPDPTDFITEILLFESSKEGIQFDDFGPFINRIIKL